MSKSPEKCVQRLMRDPNFRPMKGKTKEESALAVCGASYNRSGESCPICDIEDAVLFQEALEQVIKDLSVQTNTTEESYTLEGISFEFSETVSPEDIDKINKFAVKSVESKDVVVYTALLIDDKITRNNTLYNKDFQAMLLSLPAGEGNFVGAPILFGEGMDHQHTASAQVGRIFDAWQVVSKEKNFGVMAKIYLLKETNEELISKIDSGVLKEMSISTKVELPICSICQQNITTCDHTPGKDGCYIVMSGKGFVAETSFVAVPGSNSAKILNEDETKNFLRLENLKELVGPMIEESIKTVPTISKETMDAISAELESIKANLLRFDTSMTDFTKQVADLKKETETVVYPFDMLSAIKGLRDAIDAGKEFVIRTLAKYDIPASDFRNDPIPDLTQGLRGEDSGLIVKILYDNTVILGINLGKIESALKVVPLPSNGTYTGDVNDLVKTVRFMNDEIDSIKTRIYKLQGKFDLALEQRNSLVNETIKLGILCGKFGFDEKNLSVKFFDKFSTEEIETLKEKYFVETTGIFTPEVKVVEQPKDETKNKDVEKSASLKEIAKKILSGGH